MSEHPGIMSACGSYGGYQRHRKAGETPCGPCRVASTQYMRDLRAARPDIRRRDHLRNKARNHALERLAAECHDRFAEILAEETLGWQEAEYGIRAS